jgi:hypothetical protein
MDYAELKVKPSGHVEIPLAELISLLEFKLSANTVAQEHYPSEDFGNKELSEQVAELKLFQKNFA